MNQNEVLKNIQGIPAKRGMISADNNITFINHDRLIKHPREYKTPPPPMWGEETEEDLYDEKKQIFYNPYQDPCKGIFNFLDSREF